MSFLSSVILVAIVIKIALAYALWRWRYWYTFARSIEGALGIKVAMVTEQRERMQNRALNLLAWVNALKEENARLRNALTNVDAIVTRRPPKRKWLAMSRRIARAVIVPLVLMAWCQDGDRVIDHVQPCHGVVVDVTWTRCAL